jgi:lipopolysaccharide transport system ATP-binding protein
MSFRARDSAPAIRATGISKEYKLGRAQPRYSTLREALTNTVAGPIRALKSGRRAPPDRFFALRDVTFDVMAGEAVGIIGQNGAGKSTLLKVLSRITDPTEGRVQLQGRVGSLLEVGTGFHPELTGRENIFLNGAILGMKRREIVGRFDEIVSFAEVEQFIDTPVKHYSSGMYLRLAFAVAAHLEPEILVVDEVLAVGDMAFQKKCMGKMRDVAGEGRTVLFVSHNLSAITSLCPRAIHLHQGRIVNDGNSEAVVAGYLTSAIGASASMTWTDDDQPGKDGFALRSFSLRTPSGAPVGVHDVEEALEASIEYETKRDGLSFRCALSFNTQGACAFTLVQPTETEHARSGSYRTSVTVPGNILAEGFYTVSLSIFSSRGRKVHLCKLVDVLAFQVFDPLSGRSARGDYTEGLAGVTRPRLEWDGPYPTGTTAGPRIQDSNTTAASDDVSSRARR